MPRKKVPMKARKGGSGKKKVMVEPSRSRKAPKLRRGV